MAVQTKTCGFISFSLRKNKIIFSSHFLIVAFWSLDLLANPNSPFAGSPRIKPAQGRADFH